MDTIKDQISFYSSALQLRGKRNNILASNIAINMARQGNSKEEIINKTGLREDEVEAIYTYYKK